MTVALDRALVAADAGQVADGEPGRADPEVPERARRRSFTAKYKLEVLAEQHDEWTEGRRYLGLDVLARSRITLTPASTNTGMEATTNTDIPALSA